MTRRIAIAACAALGLIAPAGHRAAWAANIKDSESASHGTGDAWHQIVKTYDFPQVRIVQFNLPVLSHYSYLVISGKETIVVDPSRDATAYLDYARKQGLAIKGVFLTHSHADFVAGHLELAKETGCPIHQNGASGAKYKIEPLKEGSVIGVGVAAIKAMETPGHTPDSMCGAVYGGRQEAAPVALLTGDCLFVGSIGRPDLLEGRMTAASLASMSYDTWFGKLAKLPDGVVILPAHGAGSLCGAHLSDMPSSTIGEQKASNPYVQHKGRSEFIAAILEELPEAPQYFKHNAAMNRDGPPLVDWKAPLPAEVPTDESLTDATKRYVVDLRDAASYADGHVPSSVNIALRGRLETWVGMMVPWKFPLVILGDDDELKEAAFRLHRVGYVPDVLRCESWAKAGLPVRQSSMVKPADLYAQMQKAAAPMIVDVRLPNEWMGLRIGTVANLPLTHLAELSKKLDPGQPAVTVCNSAYRSSMAVGILERAGFKDVGSMAGGSEAWIEAGLPVYSAQGRAAASAAEPAKRQVRLADRISADELKRLVMDLPGTFDMVDVRPPDHFADYSLPGSKNVDLADLIENPAYLTGAGPLVIVDRDGSLAMMAAGILSQKTQRTIKALHGGLEGYWRATELGGAVKAVDLPGPAPAGPAPPKAAGPAPAAPQPAAPQTPKKKSAGC